MLLYLATVIVVSSVTYSLIEAPSRTLGRRLISNNQKHSQRTT